jgi:MFS family permease
LKAAPWHRNGTFSARRGPLASNYPAAVALVVFALVPFLLLTAAMFALAPLISKSLHLSTTALDITTGMSDAAYAFGTVLAVQFAVHLPGRRMLLGYVSAFVVAAALAAWAPNGAVFIGAFIAEGLLTSLMLIAAVPPLVTGWPVSKMPWTGMIMNMCIFGAVAIGPTVGGLQASTGNWRPLFCFVAGIALLAVVMAVLTYEDQPAQDRSAPWDFVAVALAAFGCAAAFFGASALESGRVPALVSLAPLLTGLAMIVVLIVHQYRTRHPLMPVKQITTTFPVSGIVAALCASAAAFALMELVLTALQRTLSPVHLALLFLPEFGAAVVTAGLFGVLFRTRFTPVLAISGLAVLAAAAAMLTALASGGDLLVAVGSALIGFGVGASVSPALFIAGFSLRSAQIQRVFALIELLRGVTAFLVAPVLLFVAATVGASKAAGIQATMWICCGIAVVGAVSAVALFVLGGGRLQTPDLERWTGGEPAWESLPLFAWLRGAGGEAGGAGADEGQPGQAAGLSGDDAAREDRAA